VDTNSIEYLCSVALYHLFFVSLVTGTTYPIGITYASFVVGHSLSVPREQPSGVSGDPPLSQVWIRNDLSDGCLTVSIDPRDTSTGGTTTVISGDGTTSTVTAGSSTGVFECVGSSGPAFRVERERGTADLLLLFGHAHQQ
jgi:hypothetical protein